MVLEVIEKMKTEFYKDKDKACMSHGPTDLFKFISEVFNSYESCPFTDLVKSLLSLSFKIISCFQKELKLLIIETQEMSVEVFCAITNANIKFISCLRQYIEMVDRRSELTEEEIHSAVSYSKIIQNFAQLSNSAFIRIQELVLYNISHFFSKVYDYQKFQILKFSEEIFQMIGPFFEMLQTAYSRKLWRFVLKNFSNLFIQMVIVRSVKYKPQEIKLLVKKIEGDVEIMTDIFETHLPNKVIKDNNEGLNDLILCFKGNASEFPTHILNLKLRLMSEFNDNCTKAILRLRKDLSKTQINDIQKKLKEGSKGVEEKIRKETGKMFYKSVMSEFRIRFFVTRFRQRKRERDRVKKMKIKEEKEKEIEEINDNDRLVKIKNII